MTHVQSTCDVGWWDDDSEGTLILDRTIGLELRLEETLLLPPLIPSALDRDGIVGFEMRIVEGLESLLLAEGGVFDVRGQWLFDGLGCLLLLRLAGGSLGLLVCLRSLGLLLFRELGVLLGLLALSLYCGRDSVR